MFPSCDSFWKCQSLFDKISRMFDSHCEGFSCSVFNAVVTLAERMSVEPPLSRTASNFRSAKITRDIKMEFTLSIDCVLGLPVTNSKPKFFVQFERGEAVSGKTPEFHAVVDHQRALDMLPQGLGKVAPTFAHVGYKTTFVSTLQRKGDFNYRPKVFKIHVVDAEYGTGLIGGELNLGNHVDREMMPEKSFEVPNRSEDKYLLFTLSAEPFKDAEARRKAEATQLRVERMNKNKGGEAGKTTNAAGDIDEDEIVDGAAGSPSMNRSASRRNDQMRDEKQGLSASQNSSPNASARNRGGAAGARGGPAASRSRNAQDNSSDDELGELVDSVYTKETGNEPKKSQPQPKSSTAAAPAAAPPAQRPAEKQPAKKAASPEPEQPKKQQSTRPPQPTPSQQRSQSQPEQKPEKKEKKEEAAAPPPRKDSQKRSASEPTNNQPKPKPGQAVASQPVRGKRSQQRNDDSSEDEFTAMVDTAAGVKPQGSGKNDSARGGAADRRRGQIAGDGSARGAREEPQQASAAATRERSAGAARGEPQPTAFAEIQQVEEQGAESDSSDEPQVLPELSAVKIRHDNSAEEASRPQRRIITKKTSVVSERTLTPVEVREKRAKEERHRRRRDAGQSSSSDEDVDISKIGLEPVSKEDRETKNVYGSSQSQSRDAPVATATCSQSRPTSLKPPQGAVEDAVTTRVNNWIREARSTVLLDNGVPPPEPNDHVQRVSKRQSVSKAEKDIPLPYTSQLVLEVLHTARIHNNELQQFVSDFLRMVLYDEVVKHTRHYGVWLRILLNIVEELIGYYYPVEGELPQGTTLADVVEEQEFFSSMLAATIQEKDGNFTDAEQGNGDHVHFIMDNALHRKLQPPGQRTQTRWEVEESDQDREDRMFLHAFVVIEATVVMEQLVHLLGDRVASVLTYTNRPFSWTKREEETVGDLEAAELGPTDFIFSVSRQQSRVVSSSNSTNAKMHLFSTQLGATGWLPRLLDELNVIYANVAYPQPVRGGSTAKVAAIADRKPGDIPPRVQGLLAEVFRPIFFNINTALMNRMHIPSKADSAKDDDSDAKAKADKKKKKQAADTEDQGPKPAEIMQLKTAKDAMSLKLTVSALEQWCKDHNLYNECRKELLPLRQMCDLMILPKSIFVDIKTRMEICGLVPDELVFHALQQFVADPREVVPDTVPTSLLDSMASALAMRYAVKGPAEETTGKGKKGKAQSAASQRDLVSQQVKIPLASMDGSNVGLNYLDSVIQRRKADAPGAVPKAKGEESAPIRESLEWDIR